ncbi:unnamed protein product [Boreogadus saida]
MFSRWPSPSGLTWSRCWDNMENLETAQSTSSHNLRHFTLHLVALGVARLVPNQLQDPQEDQLTSEMATAAKPHSQGSSVVLESYLTEPVKPVRPGPGK